MKKRIRIRSIAGEGIVDRDRDRDREGKWLGLACSINAKTRKGLQQSHIRGNTGQ